MATEIEISLDDPFTVPTRYWHRLEDGRVQCDVCPRTCRLHEGQRVLRQVTSPSASLSAATRI